MKKVELEKVEFIINCASIATGYPVEVIKSKTKAGGVAEARFLIMYAIKKENESASFAMVGKVLGKDHATVMYAVKKVNNYIITNDAKFKPILEKFNKLMNDNNSIEELMMSKLNSEFQDRELIIYNINLNRVITKLVRTEDKLPTKKDFELLEFIKNS